MSSDKEMENIRTRIWLEEQEPDNAFATKAAYCHGYDVYGEMLGNARWVEMLFLLFRGEAPSPAQADLLEALAVALANPGPRDQSVHAAMCGGVGGSTSASCLMAAIAVGAGQLSGGREIFLMMKSWERCGTDLYVWQSLLTSADNDEISIWPKPQHPAGFDPYGVSTTGIVKQALSRVAPLSSGPLLPWLSENRQELEATAKLPLSLAGIAAAAFSDLGFTAEQGEMLYLLLRLPGAAAHALEQKKYGHKKFPFFSLELTDDPGMENK